MANQKFDIYQHVTDRIIAAMEAGTPPWRKPWTGETGGIAFPHRSTGEPYKGINVLMLWLEAMEKGYHAAHWFTYRQAQEAGGQVRKGEKSATVVKYGTIDCEGDNGEERKIPYARAYRVFNADQCDGLPEHFYRRPEAPRDLGTKTDPALEAFFDATGLARETTDNPRAYYDMKADRIHMPPVETFHSAAGFYSTLYHEACHAAGHKSRLDRFGAEGLARKSVPLEELTAEIGACMVLARLGVAPDFDQSAAYVESWMKALRDNSRAIFTAASAAQKSADWLITAAETNGQKLAA